MPVMSARGTRGTLLVAASGTEAVEVDAILGSARCLLHRHQILVTGEQHVADSRKRYRLRVRRELRKPVVDSGHPLHDVDATAAGVQSPVPAAPDERVGGERHR